MNSSTALGEIAGFAPAYDFDDWRERAACKGVGPDIFFPSAGGANVSTYDEARTYCSRCPVVSECLAEAGNDDGFRGGMTATQRARWRSKQKVTKRRCALCREFFTAPMTTVALYCSDECRGEIRAEMARRRRREERFLKELAS